MFQRFLYSLLIALLAGSLLVGWGIHSLRQLSAEQQAEALKNKKQDISITIIEGKRREEIATQIDKAGICPYTDFINQSAQLEGKLFPDTYRFFPNTPCQTVIKTMTDNFTSKAAALNLTSNQLILASIVEREALNDTDRPIIAGVYQNRINIGMKLESDPTVQYSKDSLDYAKSIKLEDFKFWQPIYQIDYQRTDSPFNTYLIPALPPTPIDSPGLKSMLAAQSPANHDYLFFIYKNKSLLLAKTLAQHEANQE